MIRPSTGIEVQQFSWRPVAPTSIEKAGHFTLLAAGRRRGKTDRELAALRQNGPKLGDKPVPRTVSIALLATCACRVPVSGRPKSVLDFGPAVLG